MSDRKKTPTNSERHSISRFRLLWFYLSGNAWRGAYLNGSVYSTPTRSVRSSSLVSETARERYDWTIIGISTFLATIATIIAIIAS